MKQECYFCQIKGVERLIAKSEVEDQVAEEFIYCVHKLIGANMDSANAKLSAEVHRLARHHFNNENLYAKEKLSANSLLLKQYDRWKTIVRQSNNPFATAAKLAVIGNIIDYGAHCVSEDISAQIQELFQQELTIDMTAKLQNEIYKAKNILYLGDNCGEIVFDKLFIEMMNHPNVTFAVRGAPVINDITLADARQVGMDQVCRVISNGADAPSTLLELCSDTFVEAYQKADLIISKGQGNFEGLMYNDHPNTFFMLIAKCDPMAEVLGVHKYDMVVTKLEK
jgi:uncharacterized protein with ATP-grasp and redox domains